MKTTQEDRILRHLNDVGSITSYEAFQEYGITRLSAVIFNLKEKGYNISSEPQQRKNRYGEKTTFAKYSLVKGQYTTSLF